MRKIWWLMVGAALVVSVGSAQVKAFFAQSVSDLPPSRRVGGKVGDIVLRNEKITVVITAAGRAHRSAASGGNIVDVALTGAKERGADELDQIFLFLGRYPRQGRYSSVNITNDGSNGVAEVVAEGVDSDDGSLKLKTVYRLEAGKPYLLIRTTVTNLGDKPLTKFDFGDAVQWGNTRSFAPLFGFDIQRRTEILDWVGAEGYGIAYVWCTVQGKNKVINGLGWSDPVAVTSDLPPSETITYERYLIAAPSLAEAAKIAWSLQRKELYEVKGIVKSRATNKPVVGIQVTAIAGNVKVQPKNSSERPPEPLVATTFTDGKGEFVFWLPAGNYRFQAKHVARLSIRDASLELPTKLAKPVELLVSGAGVLVFEIRDTKTKELIPARLTFLGAKGTATPEFGPNFLSTGAENYVLTATGKGTRTIPPGVYRIYASRGLEYDIDAAEVIVCLLYTS
ncbi:MAG: carboxypeptidase-like regulatory domain-containing protein, partial [Armatimonadetes bacterium]|nr:carboxypeptidase-like regulatory domain-containing protein [Armatimonadota bacterium]